MFEDIIKELKNLLPDTDIRINKTRKTNDITLTGIIISNKQSTVSPCIYIDQMIKDEWTAEEIAVRVYDIYRNNQTDQNELNSFISDIENFDVICKYLSIRLINSKWNQSYLKDSICKPFLDLEMVVVLSFDHLNKAKGRILVTNQLAEIWEIDHETIFHMALDNCLKERPIISDINDILKMLSNDHELPDIPVKMFIVTNESRTYGATMILKNGTMLQLCDILGDKIIIIPSSVHETIAVPFDGSLPVKDMHEIVKIVNKEEVPITDILSDHVYVYDRHLGWLTE